MTVTAGSASAAAPSSASGEPTSTNGGGETIYVRLAVSRTARPKAWTALTTLARRHRTATCWLADITHDERQDYLILGIDFGPADDIVASGPQACAAYRLTQDIFADLFDFLPQMVPPPATTGRQLTLHTVATRFTGNTFARLIDTWPTVPFTQLGPSGYASEGYRPVVA